MLISLTEEDKKSWSYICVKVCSHYLFITYLFILLIIIIIIISKGLGLISGICCPHHDTVQSNGILRSNDFNQMLQRRSKKDPSEIGIGIDDQAAIVIQGDQFKILSTDGRSRVTKKKVQPNSTIEEIPFDSDGKFHSLNELLN